jgi:lipoyl(octanoyl) transferase
MGGAGCGAEVSQAPKLLRPRDAVFWEVSKIASEWLRIMRILKFGIEPYLVAMRAMMQAHSNVCGGGEEVLIVTEHFPVVTMGNREIVGDLVSSPELLATLGVEFVQTDRGGSVTVHEPGQAVVYPIVRLDSAQLSVKRFVWILEEAMIRVASRFGVEALRNPCNAGVWVGNNKIGAIGIRISNHVSRHGLAFNVNNSLDTFRHVVPCGLRERGVTSLERELSKGLKNSKMTSLSSMNAQDTGALIAEEVVLLVEQERISRGGVVKNNIR